MANVHDAAAAMLDASCPETGSSSGESVKGPVGASSGLSDMFGLLLSRNKGEDDAQGVYEVSDDGETAFEAEGEDEDDEETAGCEGQEQHRKRSHDKAFKYEIVGTLDETKLPVKADGDGGGRGKRRKVVCIQTHLTHNDGDGNVVDEEIIRRPTLVTKMRCPDMHCCHCVPDIPSGCPSPKTSGPWPNSTGPIHPPTPMESTCFWPSG